tara:strand:+ start:1249 stop:1929 length:681 start_codon:yes stop_codon:yes gene_type:complete
MFKNGIFMKIYDVDNFFGAATHIIRKIPIINDYKEKKNFDIALTGGRFGKFFASELHKSILEFKDWRFFLTDERFTNRDKNILNRTLIEENLFDKIDTKVESYFFDTALDIEDSEIKMSSSLRKKNINKLDFVILSLGSDGHLAGHFRNSQKIGNAMINCTENVPFSPRISFSIPWLLKAEKVFIVALGASKENAYNELFLNKGVFNIELFKSDRISFLKDFTIND